MANGSRIPTGGAPLFLGNFANNRAAMRQKFTKQLIERADRERTRQAKSRKKLLEALDFETVRGLGRKVQEEHMSKLNQFQDKWSEKWLENGRKFDDTDLLEIEKEKRQIEQEVANMRHNVTQYAKTADEITQKPYLYRPGTLANMQKYAQEGNVGKDFSSMVQYMPDTKGYLRPYMDELADIEPVVQERYDPEKQRYIQTGTNREVLAEKVDVMLSNDPYHQALLKDPDTRQQAMANRDYLINRFAQDIKQQERMPKSYERNAEEVKQLPKKYRNMVQKYNIDISDKEKLDYIEKQNDLTTRFLKGDKKLLENIVGKTIPSWGTVSSYFVGRDGTISLQSNREDQPDVQFKVNDWTDANEVVGEKIRAKNFIESQIGGEEFKGATSYLFPEWDVELQEKAPMTDIEIAKEWIDVPQSDVGERKVTKRPMGAEEDKEFKVMDKSYREELASQLKAMFPDDSFEAKTGRWTTERRPFYWTAKGEKEREYNLYEKSERERLLNDIREKITGEKATTEEAAPAGEESVSYVVDGDIYEIPQEEVDQFLKDFPNARRQ